MRTWSQALDEFKAVLLDQTSDTCAAIRNRCVGVIHVSVSVIVGCVWRSVMCQPCACVGVVHVWASFIVGVEHVSVVCWCRACVTSFMCVCVDVCTVLSPRV